MIFTENKFTFSMEWNQYFWALENCNVSLHAPRQFVAVFSTNPLVVCRTARWKCRYLRNYCSIGFIPETSGPISFGSASCVKIIFFSARMTLKISPQPIAFLHGRLNFSLHTVEQGCSRMCNWNIFNKWCYNNISKYKWKQHIAACKITDSYGLNVA